MRPECGLWGTSVLIAARQINSYSNVLRRPSPPDEVHNSARGFIQTMQRVNTSASRKLRDNIASFKDMSQTLWCVSLRRLTSSDELVHPSRSNL